MSDWKHIDKMFIGNITHFSDTRYGLLTKEEILKMNPPYLEVSVIKPAVNPGGDIGSLIYREIIRIFRNGKVERKYDYICQEDGFEKAYILNPIGKKMLDYIAFKDKEIESND